MGKAPHQLAADAYAIIGSGIAVTRPAPDGLAIDRLQARDDQVQRLIPARLVPRILAAALMRTSSAKLALMEGLKRPPS